MACKKVTNLQSQLYRISLADWDEDSFKENIDGFTEDLIEKINKFVQAYLETTTDEVSNTFLITVKGSIFNYPEQLDQFVKNKELLETVIDDQFYIGMAFNIELEYDEDFDSNMMQLSEPFDRLTSYFYSSKKKKFVYQGYSQGEYDTGFISDGGTDYYLDKESNEVNFIKEVQKLATC